MSSYEFILLCFLSAWKSPFRKLKASSAVWQHLGVGWAPIRPWKWGLCCWGPCCGTWNVHPAVRRSWGSASFQIWVFGFLLDMWTTLSTEAKTNLAVPPSFMQVGIWLPQKEEVTSSLCVSQCGPPGVFRPVSFAMSHNALLSTYCVDIFGAQVCCRGSTWN